ncbi:hypothetical protein KL939_001898 [Ogataea angusta]|nr:hypothetical protein KL939_001898 [Ogataea angusta]
MHSPISSFSGAHATPFSSAGSAAIGFGSSNVGQFVLPDNTPAPRPQENDELFDPLSASSASSFGPPIGMGDAGRRVTYPVTSPGSEASISALHPALTNEMLAGTVAGGSIGMGISHSGSNGAFPGSNLVSNFNQQISLPFNGRGGYKSNYNGYTKQPQPDAQRTQMSMSTANVHRKHSSNKRRGEDASKFLNATLNDFVNDIYFLCKDQHGSDGRSVRQLPDPEAAREGERRAAHRPGPERLVAVCEDRARRARHPRAAEARRVHQDAGRERHHRPVAVVVRGSSEQRPERQPRCPEVSTEAAVVGVRLHLRCRVRELREDRQAQTRLLRAATVLRPRVCAAVRAAGAGGGPELRRAQHGPVRQLRGAVRAEHGGEPAACEERPGRERQTAQHRAGDRAGGRRAAVEPDPALDAQVRLERDREEPADPDARAAADRPAAQGGLEPAAAAPRRVRQLRAADGPGRGRRLQLPGPERDAQTVPGRRQKHPARPPHRFQAGFQGRLHGPGVSVRSQQLLIVMHLSLYFSWAKPEMYNSMNGSISNRLIYTRLPNLCIRQTRPRNTI